MDILFGFFNGRHLVVNVCVDLNNKFGNPRMAIFRAFKEDSAYYSIDLATYIPVLLFED